MKDKTGQADKITQAIAQGRMVEAKTLCRIWLTEQPDNAEAWFWHNRVALQTGDGKAAWQAIAKARELTPDEPRYHLQALKTLLATHQLTRATAEAIKLSGNLAEEAHLHSELGLIFNQLKHYPQARFHFEQAVRLAPGNGDHLYNLATVLRFLGDIDGAELRLEQALEQNADDHQAWSLLSQLKSWSLANNHIPALRKALGKTSNPAAAVALHYALAKELEDIADHEAAFEALCEGAELRRRHMQYRVEDDLAILNALKNHYHAERMAVQDKGHPDADPIFIVGMPRTGSTLVERILANHCQVHSCGEVNEFALRLMNQMNSQGLVAETPLELVAQSTRVDFAALGKAYLAALKPLRGTEPRVIDKLPFNYLYLGLIAKALPNAKIIHVRRNPMDTCFAVYKQLFQNAYPFSYDRDELARYYVGYHQLMAHWYRVMPGRIHTVDYENLVTNTESEVRSMLAYCELDWQPECLEFHLNRSASTTASATQVRQPVYTSSVGKWHPHRRHLQSWIERFNQAGIMPAEL